MTQSSFKKIKMNFILSLLGQVITVILGIIVPRFFITSFGSEINGYIKGLDQVFVYVALLESGIGGASLQALYSPMGRNDRDEINGIISATNSYYKKTGAAYLAVMLALAFLYPLLISTELDYWVMVGLFFIVGTSGVMPYFFNAKYSILLSADGKEYVNSFISTTAQILMSAGKIIAILCGANVFAVQAIYLCVNLIKALLMWIYIRKKYDWIDLKAPFQKSVLSQKKFVFVHQVSTLIFNNTDTLMLTFFCGLTTASIYALYKTLIGMIGAVTSMVSNSLNFKLGQTFGDRERFLRLHNAFETFNVTLVFCLCSIALVFMKPFLTLYTEGMDANYVLNGLPLLFVVVEILSYARIPSQNVITYAGHFKQTQWRSMLESAINLACSLLFVYFWDIYGVLLGTVVALLYRVNDIIVYSNSKILMRSPFKTYKIWIVNLLFSSAFVVIFELLPLTLDSYFSVILCAVAVCIIIIPLQFVINYALNKEARIALVSIIKSTIGKKKTDIKDQL